MLITALVALGSTPLRAAVDAPAAVPGVLHTIVPPGDARWTPAGVPFAGTNGYVTSFATGPNAELIIGGAFTMAGSVSARRIVRWDGSSFHALGAGLDNVPTAVALDAHGNVYAAGWFQHAGGVPAQGLAMWDGSAWHALGTGFTASPYSSITNLVVDGSGTLWAGGAFTFTGSTTTTTLASWDGTSWHAVPNVPFIAAHCLGVDGQGTLYVMGVWEYEDPGSQELLEAWNPTSQTWTPTGAGAAFSAYAPSNFYTLCEGFATDAQGNLILAIEDGYYEQPCVLLQGPSWTPLPAPALPGGAPCVNVASVAAGPNGDIWCAAGNPGGAGSTWFTPSYDFTLSSSSASTWSPVCELSLINSPPLLTVLSDDTVVGACSGYEIWPTAYPTTEMTVLGAFEVSPTVAPLGGWAWGVEGLAPLPSGAIAWAAGPVAASGVDPAVPAGVQAWVAGQGSEPLPPGLNGETSDIAALPNGTLVAGGTYTLSDSTTTGAMALVGSTWQPLGQAPAIYELATDATGTCLAYTEALTAAVWNSASASWIAAPLTQVRAVGGDGAGGGYAAILDPVQSLNIDLLHAPQLLPTATWTTVATFTAGSEEARIDRIEPLADGSICIVGSFTSVGSTSASNIVRWDGTAWDTLGGGCNGEVVDAVLDQDFLYATGTFTSAGSTSASNIAVWNGSQWFPLGDGIDGWPQRLLIDGAHNLWVAGEIDQAGGQDSVGLSEWLAPTPLAIQFTDLTQVATGSPLGATITTTPLGIGLSVTYNGSATLPSTPGAYTVVATCIDPSYAGTASGIFTLTTPSSTTTTGTGTATATGTGTATATGTGTSTTTTTATGTATSSTSGTSTTASSGATSGSSPTTTTSGGKSCGLSALGALVVLAAIGIPRRRRGHR